MKIGLQNYRNHCLVATLFLSACSAGDSSESIQTSSDAAHQQIAMSASADRQPRDEIIYFVMPDRFENGDVSNDQGGIEGGVLDHGYDPTQTGFYHGGDLAGLTQRLDYIQGLGVTAVWLTPVFQNRAVQGAGEDITAGYHGYWITDFLSPDAHIGSREEFRTFVDEVHARDMRVYMDIITNHTADIFAMRECHDPASPLYIEALEYCEYRTRADYPYTTRGGVEGAPINEGFLGDDPRHQTEENFANLTETGWAYTPYLPEGVPTRNPDWLNDVTVYHNRGESEWYGESELYGDFAGLDDINTEHPRAVQGMIDIYKSWITDFRIDGYRIDTAKHVQPEFWQTFMPAIMEHARAEGIEHFHVFGEVYEFDSGQLARYISQAQLPSFLDFAFQGSVRDFVVNNGPGSNLERLFRMDHVYPGGADTAAILPTFLGNHDMGRFAGFLRESDPQMSDEDMFERVRLAYAMMMFSRGVPTIYYGDEQGFVSDGGDRGARENMFPSQVDSYNDNDLIATDATTADDNFNTGHPLYIAISEMAAIRQGNIALRRGEQVTRYADHEDSVLVLSRLMSDRGEEILIAFNAESEAVSLNVTVDGASMQWQSLSGACELASTASGSYAVNIPAYGYVICRSGPN